MNGPATGNWPGKLRWLAVLLLLLLAAWGVVRWFDKGSGTVPESNSAGNKGQLFSEKISPPVAVPAPAPPATVVLDHEPLRLILAESMRGSKPSVAIVPPVDPATARPSGPDLTFVTPTTSTSPESPEVTPPPTPGAETASSAPTAATATATPAALLYEEPQPAGKKERTPTRPRTAATTTTSRGERTLGTLAIIIDDLGYDWPHSKAITELPADITLAILPKVPFTREVARLGKKLGKEMLLHQPMEPLRYPHTSPGPGAMLLQMDTQRQQAILRENLAQLPEVVGINNHMGSRLTEQAVAMDSAMQVLLEKQLFFIDSRTSDNSVAADRALAQQVPTAVRDIFLDNTAEEGAILRQLHRLERLALSHGEAIGIGHPYRATVAALQQWLPTLPGKGIRVQRVSRFLRPAAARARYPELPATASKRPEALPTLGEASPAPAHVAAPSPTSAISGE
ncbi:divergent polysaccharide deacetylase family protein [Candidatus Magnetaquicoccus inordinatus]|uniref:divergent polysaccharide deacetylase family protein n=1 Tax=Candidatus Magnetaquicoccus inordinatus TaxID=2496818 RepID=UPI00102B07FC|nr:divergent polysaccharide deacetylase family protein [Candidatus Magnetaquicoccus inordinatus]